MRNPIEERKLEIQQELREYTTTRTHCDCDPDSLTANLVYYEGGRSVGGLAVTIDEYRVVVRCEKHNVQGGASLVLDGKLQLRRD